MMTVTSARQNCNIAQFAISVDALVFVIIFVTVNETIPLITLRTCTYPMTVKGCKCAP